MTQVLYETDHDSMSPMERIQFSKLVAEGGAVSEDYVNRGIQRPGVRLVIARHAKLIVGVAALKVPKRDYRESIEAKSGIPITGKDFPFELGYVSVAQEHGGRGVGGVLCDFVVRLIGDKGALATTGTPQMLTSILPRFGFRWVGATWKGVPNKKTGLRPDLHLMVRPSLAGHIAPHSDLSGDVAEH